MGDHVLITGGAGFIGSHLADELLRQGYRVRALDNLSTQVHGPGKRRPTYLDPNVELVVGDIRDRETVDRALRGIDAVFHFAAAVGVGQSMYQPVEYTSVNTVGTAVLLDALSAAPVRRLVVASSMSVYGEGLYRTRSGNSVEDASRDLDALRRGEWDPTGPDGAPLVPEPTPEWKRPALESIYALSKYDQERMCLMMGRAYRFPTVALRFFNVYGTRQSLSNPYTGVLAIFASRLLNDRRPLIYEDGHQLRDFVSVRDVARACRLALDAETAVGRTLNVGSGQSRSVLAVAEAIASKLGRDAIAPELSGKYRVGDVRHCVADITSAKQLLGYEPQVPFEDGLAELSQWLEGQIAKDGVIEARAELEARGLTL